MSKAGKSHENLLLQINNDKKEDDTMEIIFVGSEKNVTEGNELKNEAFLPNTNQN